MNLPPPIPTHVNTLNVLISGGTTGMGRETALVLGNAGAGIFIHGRDAGALHHALGPLKECNARPGGVTSDISKPGEIERRFSAAEDFPGSINVWINCAAPGWSDSISIQVCPRRQLI